MARAFSFGFRSTAADVMYLQSIQILGNVRKSQTAAQGAPDDRAMNRLLTYATDLDAKFAGAYRFAGNAMPRPTTDGKVANVLQTETLLEKGARERPDDWRIPFTLGVIETFYLGKFDSAARHLAVAARSPKAPPWVALLATRAAAEGGDLRFGEELAEAMIASATEESARKEWEARLTDLRMERDLRTIDAALAKYAARAGAPTRSLDDLVRSGDLARIPHEPHGGRYALDEKGRAKSTAAPRLRISGRYGTTAGMEVVP